MKLELNSDSACSACVDTGRTGQDVIASGWSNADKQRQPHAALVEQINPAPVLHVLVRIHGPQAVALAFGEDQVVNFRLDRDAHRTAAHLRIQRSGDA